MKNIKHIVFGYEDYIGVSLSEAIKKGKIEYFDNNLKKFAQRVIRKIFILRNIPNKLVDLIFYLIPKSWVEIPFHHYKNMKDACFVFYANCIYSRRPALLSYLKRKNPNAKFVYIITNKLMGIESLSYRRFDEAMKIGIYDLFISTDRTDAAEFEIGYYGLVNSCFTELDVDSQNLNSDIYFCGKDKGRRKTIEDIYKKMVDYGYVCDFHILCENLNDSNQIKGIHYFNEPIKYLDIIKGIRKTKCILDISFDTCQTAATLRVSEAVLYRKKLISNNEHIKKEAYFKEKQMHIIDSIENIDLTFFESKLEEQDYVDAQNFSPIKLFEYIDEQLK